MKKILCFIFAVYTALLSTTLSFPSFADSGELNPYRDVKKSSWYSESAFYCFDHGYMKGTAKGSFSPNTKITRAMAVTVICNIGTDDPFFEPHGFSDVAKGEWYYNAVEWAYYNSVTGGTGNNRFSPNREITRQDFVTMLYNYYLRYAHDLEANQRDYDPFGYSDITLVSEYAIAAIDWAIKYEMLSGYPDATIRPKALISRAEAAKIICVFDEKFGHQWQESVIEQRSCTVNGRTLYTCSFCGEERTVITEAYHIWDGGRVVTNVGCTVDGIRQYCCINCTASYSVTTPATGHKWAATSKVEPTFTSGGYTVYTCSGCKATKNDDFTPKKTYYDDDGRFTIDEYLGIKDLPGFLTEHQNEFLGTPYRPLSDYINSPWMLLRDKGHYGSQSSMNCTGFVASVVQRSGGDLSKLVTWNPGAYANGYNWIRTVENKGIYKYTFYSVQQALNSGKMRKGDIIFFVPPSGSDCHLGIFWGDTPYDNKIMHCTCPSSYNYSSGVRISGVQISGISSGTPYTHFYVIPMSGVR